MSDTIIVIGTIDLDPARMDDAVAAALEIMEPTRAEEGNEAYTFSRGLADPGRLHLMEQWSSEEAMDAHMTTAHLATFMDKIGKCGVTSATLTQWRGATPTKVM
jgi:quinol monooxygenase YgiN